MTWEDSSSWNQDNKQWDQDQNQRDQDWKNDSWPPAEDVAGKEETKWESNGQEANWWDKPQEEQAPPPDPWAQAAADSVGSSSWAKADPPADTQQGWGSGGDDYKAPAPNANAFWEEQKWNKERGVLPRKEDWEMDKEDYDFFTERLGSNAGIDFNKYDTVPVDVSGEKSAQIPQVDTFQGMYDMFSDCVPSALQQNVERCQYEKPTPVQKFAIPVGLVGRDIMCCAQTGSGKTAAFLFPVIGRMMKSHDSPCGLRTEPFDGPCSPDTLVLTPTRELCIQIYEEALKFCHRTPYRVCRVYGGEQAKIQMAEIAKGADVLVATPGRLNDFIGRGIVSVSSVFVLVLDEADRMLDMGFEPQIREICQDHEMPSKDNRQTMMFSATFPETCQKMAQDFLYNYVWIGVGIVGGAVDTVEQRLEQVTPKDKYEKLFEILDKFFLERENKERCLVFVNAKDTAKWLDEQLYARKIDTGALHGNLEQHERETNLKRFRNGEIDVMIATDVAARGLDIEKVGMVINYDMPQEIDSYIHRIGRTGRIGNKGIAITFISCDENGSLEKLDGLKELLRIMRDANSKIPDWLEGLAEPQSGSRNGYGSWGGKDYRSWDQAADTTTTSTSWDNWKQDEQSSGW